MTSGLSKKSPLKWGLFHVRDSDNLFSNGVGFDRATNNGDANAAGLWVALLQIVGQYEGAVDFILVCKLTWTRC